MNEEEQAEAMTAIGLRFKSAQNKAYLQGSIDILDSLHAGFNMLSTVGASPDVIDFIEAMTGMTKKMREDILATFASMGVTLDG